MRCPICDTLTQREGNPNRPFCSERCRMIDFGHWIDEDYSVPVNQPDFTDDQPATSERNETANDY